MTDFKALSEDQAPDQPHPSTFSPATFALLIVLAIFGAIIGIQLILQLDSFSFMQVLASPSMMSRASRPL
jgi:hypothetical protein